MSSNKSVLITGAGGFIGLNVAKEFTNYGFNVYAMVHKHIPDELLAIQGIKIIHADIRNKESVMKALDGFIPDIVVHLAGIASDIGKLKDFIELNYEPIKYLALIPKEKIIFISTTDVYGLKDFKGEDEDSLPLIMRPINPYPKYKIKAEKWLVRNLPTSKYVIIRPGAVYGEGDKTIENRVVDFLKHSPFIIHFGKWKGENRWPMTNVKTVTKAILILFLINCFEGEAINIVDEKRTTIDEYYKEIIKKYFPTKKFKTIVFPMWFGKIIGATSSYLSNLFKLKQPIFDPTSYSLLHISSNLDFSCEKLKKLLNENPEK